MQEDIIIVAKRENAHKNVSGALSTFCLFTLFLIIDIIFYIKDKYTWEFVLLIISAVLDFLALFALLFAWSNYRYAQKIIDKPLITFDGANTFTIIDCLLHKEVMINKNDVIEVKIGENGDAYLWYRKNEKKSSIFIGYSNRENQELINNELHKYKNLFN